VATRTQQEESDPRWLAFAGIYLMIAGALNVIWGITALVKKEHFADDGLLFSSLQFWGWIGILIGAVQAVVGFLVYQRRLVAQLIAMLIAMIALLFNFTTVGAYPVWSCIAIVANALVLWAVTAHGMDG
jgi:hypothetical protein